MGCKIFESKIIINNIQMLKRQLIQQSGQNKAILHPVGPAVRTVRSMFARASPVQIGMFDDRPDGPHSGPYTARRHPTNRSQALAQFKARLRKSVNFRTMD